MAQFPATLAPVDIGAWKGGFVLDLLRGFNLHAIKYRWQRAGYWFKETQASGKDLDLVSIINLRSHVGFDIQRHEEKQIYYCRMAFFCYFG